MKIYRKKKFLKQYLKLSKEKQKKINNALLIFEQNPFEKILKNHQLNGKFSDLRSISITGDLRIIFKEENNYLVVMLIQVGSHSQLY